MLFCSLQQNKMSLQKKLEEQVNCSICLDRFSNPKLLLCNHVYCESCLDKLVTPEMQDLACPTCRKVTPMESGVAGLPPAFRINQLLEILSEQQGDEDVPTSPQDSKDAATALASPVSRQSSIMGCSDHPGKVLDVYCETCDALICCRCALKGGNHVAHEYEDLEEAFEKHKKEMLKLLAPMDEQLASVNAALTNIDACSGKISDLQVAVETGIHNTITQLQETLTARKAELVEHLRSITQTKLKHLASQRDQIETTQTHLHNFLSLTREDLEKGNKEDVMLKRTAAVKKAKELSENFQPETLEPITAADVVFLASADVNRGCREYGKIVSLHCPDPSKCCITGDCVEATSVAVGTTSTALLHTFTINDELCSSKEAINYLECELVSELTGTSTIASIESKGKGEYEITYQPSIKGRNHLHIQVDKQHVTGSPFEISVTSPVENAGKVIQTLADLKEPEGVAISSKGELIVSEWAGHCVTIFKPDGSKIFSFGSKGSSPGQFESPNGVVLDDEGNIFVADTWNHRVQKFTSYGCFKAEVGSRGSGPLKFYQPRGLAAFRNKIYVGDSSGCVQILNSDLSFCGSFGRKGSSKGQFDGIGHIACDPKTGNLFLADSCNHRIQVFTAEGKFVRMFGKHGNDRGNLDCPFGVAVDAGGLVYVTEAANNRVSVFNPRGQFVTMFGCKGEEPGEFMSPNGIRVDSCGVIYVCDSENNRVQMF